MQFTPPGSPASIHFGIGMTTAAPGSAQNLLLAVEDIDTDADGNTCCEVTSNRRRKR